MAAYRIEGGRLYYIEHQCASTEGKETSPSHMINNRVHNSKYVVRMFFTGDLNASFADANDFDYMTEGVGGGCPEAYVNCPLCGSKGHIIVDKNNMVEIKEIFNQPSATESPFK
jgi:hypothetical protein